MTDVSKAQIPVLQAALKCACPQCGKASLFNGYLEVRRRCPVCDFDYENIDPGDGPAIFIILIVGFIVSTGALIVEKLFHPEYWVHGVLWVPTTLILALALLRPFKAAMIALQHKHKAAESRTNSLKG